jgi:hypothetical protein
MFNKKKQISDEDLKKRIEILEIKIENIQKSQLELIKIIRKIITPSENNASNKVSGFNLKNKQKIYEN